MGGSPSKTKKVYAAATEAARDAAPAPTRERPRAIATGQGHDRRASASQLAPTVAAPRLAPTVAAPRFAPSASMPRQRRESAPGSILVERAHSTPTFWLEPGSPTSPKSPVPPLALPKRPSLRAAISEDDGFALRAFRRKLEGPNAERFADFLNDEGLGHQHAFLEAAAAFSAHAGRALQEERLLNDSYDTKTSDREVLAKARELCNSFLDGLGCDALAEKARRDVASGCVTPNVFWRLQNATEDSLNAATKKFADAFADRTTNRSDPSSRCAELPTWDVEPSTAPLPRRAVT